MTDRDIYEKLAELRHTGIAACLATIVKTAGSTPRAAGAKMIICTDGTTFGSVGGGCGENQVRSAALQASLIGQAPRLLEVDLTDDLGTKGGDVCGGKMWIFVAPCIRG
jgi:xanthine dehydrogenase accessory factor